MTCVLFRDVKFIDMDMHAIPATSYKWIFSNRLLPFSVVGTISKYMYWNQRSRCFHYHCHLGFCPIFTEGAGEGWATVKVIIQGLIGPSVSNEVEVTAASNIAKTSSCIANLFHCNLISSNILFILPKCTASTLGYAHSPPLLLSSITSSTGISTHCCTSLSCSSTPIFLPTV